MVNHLEDNDLSKIVKEMSSIQQNLDLFEKSKTDFVGSYYDI